MRIPARSPPLAEIKKRLTEQRDPARLANLFGRKIVDEKGRYLHWDDFRRKVSDDGLSPEEGWFAMRTARVAAAQSVPLFDTEGRRFSFCEPASLRAALQFADLNAGGILGTAARGFTQADGARHFARSLVEEPFASSVIEGAATTRQRAKQMIFEKRAPRTRDELMVLNNHRGMEFVKTILAEPLTVEAILETHRIITMDTLDNSEDAGRVRQNNEVQVVDDSSNEILHQPPSFETLEERLQKLCDFANASDGPGDFVHSLVRAMIVHFALAYDHPFVDGNGRTARALFYWSALRSGYWLIEYVSISSIIAEAKTAYGQAFLRTETDESDLTYFLLHQAGALKLAIERLLQYAQRKREEVAAFERRVLDDEAEFNRRQAMLLNDAVRGRVASISIAEHEKQHKVSRLTARFDLEELVRLGLFKKRKQGRSNQYIPAKDLTARLAARSPDVAVAK